MKNPFHAFPIVVVANAVAYTYAFCCKHDCDLR